MLRTCKTKSLYILILSVTHMSTVEQLINIKQVSTGVRAEFMTNNMHRSGVFWSRRQRYPEMWSRFSGNSQVILFVH